MIDQDVKRFVLVYCARKNDAIVSGIELRQGIRAAFPSVAFTEGDLRNYLTQCEEAGWLSGTNDPLLGPMWLLTAAGKIRAQQL